MGIFDRLFGIRKEISNKRGGSLMNKRPIQIQGIENFIESVVCCDTNAECRIKISDYPILYIALVQDLNKLGLSDFQISETIWDNLSAKCPQCKYVIDGPKLGALGLIHLSNSNHAKIAEKTPIALRFEKGMCPNEMCSCTEIMLQWHVY